MDRQTAERLIELAKKCSAIADSSVGVASAGASADELKIYRRHVGVLMSAIFERVMVPLYAEYPDLAPDWYREMDEDAAKRRGEGQR